MISNDSVWDPRPRIVRPGEPRDDEITPPETATVMVEVGGNSASSEVDALRVARTLESVGFEIDEEYGAVPMESGRSFVVRGRIRDEQVMDTLSARHEVVKVWRDTPIAPF